MTTYGLTIDGFTPKPMAVIRAEIEARMRDQFGQNLPLGDRTIEGQFVAIMSEALSKLWLLGEEIYSSQDPDKASAAALDAISALTGTFRQGASYSHVTLTLTGDAASVVPSGSIAQTPDTEIQFQTETDATLVALDAWTISTAYAIGDRATNVGLAYVCITAGTSAGSGGPTTTDDDITDGTAHWRYMGEGTAAIDVDSRATLTGPLVAISGGITEIVTAIGGWRSVINLLDASIGRDQMTDELLRQLREQEIGQPGTSTLAAIKAALLELQDVSAVTVFENNTDFTDGDGIPPHSIEALVTGGADQDIWDSLLANVVGGIRTHGDEVGTSTDDEGVDHTMEFTRPELVPIYIDIEVIVDEGSFPIDGADQIRAAIVAWGDDATKAGGGHTGKDAVSRAISAQIFKVDGVLDTPTVNIDVAPGPTSDATISIGLREQATYDTSRIGVTVTPGTP